MVWCPGVKHVNQLYLEKLLKLQKQQALRFIYFSEQNQYAIPLLFDSGVLPLKFSYYELLDKT